MKTFVLVSATAAIFLRALAAQDAAKPEPTPDAAAAALEVQKPTQLLASGSFESPRVPTRLPRAKGGDIMRYGARDWVRFDDKQGEEGGKLTVGLTNEIARTGKQSIYVEFDKLSAPFASAELASDFIPVMPGKMYRVAICGRNDRKKPLTIDQRIPYLRLQVDFFQSDKETQTDEPVFRVQPMPGSRNRAPFFVTTQWSEYYADLKSPEDAAFMRVTWTWMSAPEAGETSGIIYFDDATIVGERPPQEEAKEEPSDSPEPAVDAPAPAPAKAAEAPAASGAQPARPKAPKRK